MVSPELWCPRNSARVVWIVGDLLGIACAALLVALQRTPSLAPLPD
ncbi:MAG: hypothetical protein ABIG44_09950 [Planctomycetota bacterium]